MVTTITGAEGTCTETDQRDHLQVGPVAILQLSMQLVTVVFPRCLRGQTSYESAIPFDPK